ncbi:hypothetical protein PF005_g32649 [Phytophthora fragariae]|uniref:Uncharacterized protein n=1 Tax=Phytophthora fragariae TaxID=53985 RepID=A0A6A3V1D4_9STRA|nr:hypothetical protein PF005_g32649 [Phytophthora fragariae]
MTSRRTRGQQSRLLHCRRRCSNPGPIFRTTSQSTNGTRRGQLCQNRRVHPSGQIQVARQGEREATAWSVMPRLLHAFKR